MRKGASQQVKRYALVMFLLMFLTGCTFINYSTDTEMKAAWKASKGEHKELDCNNSGDHLFVQGFEYIVFNCNLNRGTNNGTFYKIYGGSFEKSEFPPYVIRDGLFFEAKDVWQEGLEGNTMHPALGYVDNEKFTEGEKFKLVLGESGEAVARKVVVQFALWDEKQKIWLGISKSFTVKIPADPERVAYEAGKLEIQAENNRQYADEQIAKNSYDEGYAFIWENSADFLLTMPGLLTSFDVKGNPVKREMNEFCKSLYSETLIARGHLTSLRESARNEWNKGCFKAAMKISLSDLYRGND